MDRGMCKSKGIKMKCCKGNGSEYCLKVGFKDPKIAREKIKRINSLKKELEKELSSLQELFEIKK